jgi:hypothetical protein
MNVLAPHRQAVKRTPKAVNYDTREHEYKTVGKTSDNERQDKRSYSIPGCFNNEAQDVYLFPIFNANGK